MEVFFLLLMFIIAVAMGAAFLFGRMIGQKQSIDRIDDVLRRSSRRVTLQFREFEINGVVSPRRK